MRQNITEQEQQESILLHERPDKHKTRVNDHHQSQSWELSDRRKGYSTMDRILLRIKQPTVTGHPK